jgi:hypothetical protein
MSHGRVSTDKDTIFKRKKKDSQDESFTFSRFFLLFFFADTEKVSIFAPAKQQMAG